MKPIFLLLALLALACCAPVSCTDTEKDGGIGGTGSCTSQTLPSDRPA